MSEVLNSICNRPALLKRSWEQSPGCLTAILCIHQKASLLLCSYCGLIYPVFHVMARLHKKVQFSSLGITFIV